jgi:hypothetical protein
LHYGTTLPTAIRRKAQAVSKAGIKIERLMEENRKIRNQVKKLISIFRG